MESSAYKELKLSSEEALDLLRTFTDGANGTLSVEQKPNHQKNICVEVPGHKKALLALYDTKNGLTINFKVGPNQDLSRQLADNIAAKCTKVSTVSKSIPSISNTLFNSLLDVLRSVDATVALTDKEKEVEAEAARETYTLKLHWYKTTNTLLIQGKTSNLLDDVLLWVGDNVVDKPEEIVKLLFESFECLKATEINFPDKMIDDKLSKLIGPAYQNFKVLKDAEKKWLKTSYFLCNLAIELPEYYATVSSSIKVIEGILKRICIQKFGHASFGANGGFNQFDGTTHKLKPTYESQISDVAARTCIENLYNFYGTRRNSYQHNNGIAPSLVPDKIVANEILEEIVDLIKEVGSSGKKLL